jgi:hypothetical protein
MLYGRIALGFPRNICLKLRHTLLNLFLCTRSIPEIYTALATPIYNHVFTHTSVIATQLEVVPASTSVRHGASQIAVLIENNTIRTGAFAAIKLSPISHDRELQVGRWDGERKALIVVLGMRIVVAADGLAVLVVAAARVHSVVDIILGITVVAADGTVGLAGENVGCGAHWCCKNRGAEEAEEEEGLEDVSDEIECYERIIAYFEGQHGESERLGLLDRLER